MITSLTAPFEVFLASVDHLLRRVRTIRVGVSSGASRGGSVTFSLREKIWVLRIEATKIVSLVLIVAFGVISTVLTSLLRQVSPRPVIVSLLAIRVTDFRKI